MEPNKEFYERLLALTAHIYDELEELSQLRDKYDGQIENIDTLSPMLSDLQITTVSVDTIAKLTNKDM